jgi:hypothetical protein
VREAVLTNRLTALNQLQPIRPVWKASRAGSQTACLIKAGTCCVYFITDARVIASARSGKLCVLDLRLDQKIGASGACTHACMRRGSG